MQNVTIDREKFIGGSDIPSIMGISPFRTRFELLQEKAQIRVNEFEGNRYTEYGNIMEPKIREFLNRDPLIKANFKEDKKIEEHEIIGYRYHADGVDKKARQVLEIKTTSRFSPDLEGYKHYLVQLLFGMKLYGYQSGILAVYNRPEDFSEEVEISRLQVIPVSLKDHKGLLAKIDYAVGEFVEDLKKIKDNPFLSEADLIPQDLTVISEQVVQLERELKAYEEAKKNYESLKAELHAQMTAHAIKKWTTNEGIQISNVEDGKDSTTEKFDEKRFADENPKLYASYMRETKKKGRKGYVKITYPQK